MSRHTCCCSSSADMLMLISMLFTVKSFFNVDFSRSGIWGKHGTGVQGMPDEELCQVSPKSHNVLKRCNQTPALMRSFLEPLLFLTNIPLPASKFASCFGNYCHRTIVGHEPLTNLHYILNPPHIGLRKVHCPSVLWEMRRNTLAAFVAQN